MKLRRALLVEDERLMADALVELLEVVRPGLEVVGVCATMREARGRLAELAPDLAIVDLILDDGNAVDLIRTTRRESPATRILVLTNLRDAFAAHDAFSAGALGYVLKYQPANELGDALDALSAGRRYVSPLIAERLEAEPARPGEPSGVELLSRRELEVLRLLAAGHRAAEVARRLSISIKTIDTHRSNMYRKLALRNVVDLLRFASANGIGIRPSVD
jgi:DNA-binding NarL/FixJ family response regulator